MKNRSLLPVLAFGALVLVGITAQSAEAKQTSIDAQLLEAFENIDQRVNAHELNVVAVRARLADLTLTMEKHRTALASLPTGSDDPSVRSQRRLHHAKLIESTAMYLNQSFKLADQAAVVISDNLSELAELAKAIPNSLDAQNSAIEIENRIQKNIDAGHSMRQALVQMRDWSQQNPGIAERFQSLQRITQALDRKITFDKNRLAGRRSDPSGVVGSRHQEALDRTMTHLADAYAEVGAEKSALKDLRDELEVAIHLSRLEMTQEVLILAAPQMGNVRLPSSGVGSLRDITGVIREVNESMLAETYYPSPGDTSGAKISPISGSPQGLEISPTENF